MQWRIQKEIGLLRPPGPNVGYRSQTPFFGGLHPNPSLDTAGGLTPEPLIFPSYSKPWIPNCNEHDLGVRIYPIFQLTVFRNL